MIITFIVAAPLGAALGFFGLAVLPPELADRLYAAFLVLIGLGGLGVALFVLPTRGKRQAERSPPAATFGANVIPFERRASRTAHPLTGRPAVGLPAAPVTALRVRKAKT